MTSKFLTPLVAEESDEQDGLWQLTEALSYRSDLLGFTVTVPAGFVTDFASVPRVLGIYDLEGGRCNKAATIHDFLYSAGSAGAASVDRETADKVLREAILASGYAAFHAYLFFTAVRIGGASHWRKPNQDQPAHVLAAMQNVSPGPALRSV